MDDKQFKKLIETLEPISMYYMIQVNKQCEEDEAEEKIRETIKKLKSRKK